MNVEFQGHNADLDNVRGQNRTLAAATLIIPTTFEEALSYAEQIIYLYHHKQNKLLEGEGVTLTDNPDGTTTISISAEESRGISSIVGVVGETGTTVTVTLTDGTTQEFFVEKGEQGPQGVQGVQGIQGPAGQNGANGEDGQDGFSPIAQVVQTSAGAVVTITDANGTTEAYLYNGQDGAEGPQGPKGDTGATGPQGPKGDTGETGATGPQGPVGPQGPQGIPGTGEDGVGISDITFDHTDVDGNNVYLVTLSNNQTYTFTANRGPKGDTGATGPQGPTGATGPQGPAGNDGTNGTDGNDGFSPIATVTQNTGGCTISITDVNGTTTATLSDGATGATGPQGPQGEQGIQGVQGPQGDTGATGATGPQGPAGPGVPDGGSTGQVLVKRSWADYDTEWQTPSGGAVTVTPATNYGREVGSITADGVTQNLYAGLPYPDNREVINIFTNETALSDYMQVTNITCYIPDTAYAVPVQLTVWSSNNEVIFTCDMDVNIYYYDNDISIQNSSAIVEATYPTGEYVVNIPQFTSTSGVWDTTNRLSIKPLATGSGSTSAKSIKVTSGYITSATISGGTSRHLDRPSSWGGSLTSFEGQLGFEIIEVDTDNGTVYQFIPLTNVFEYLFIKWSADVSGDYMNVTVPSNVLTINDNLFTDNGTIYAYTSFGGGGSISNASKTLSGLVKVAITKNGSTYTLRFNFYGRFLGVSASGVEYIF